MNFAWCFIILIVIIAVLIIINNKLDNRPDFLRKKSAYKYRAKPHLMTTREEYFYKILAEIFGRKCYIFPQIHLSACLDHKVRGQNWKGAFSHINGKSLDFVLVSKDNFRLLCAIELDDSSHDIEQRAIRDQEVERILREANIPLIRFRDISKLTKQEIVDKIAAAIK